MKELRIKLEERIMEDKSLLQEQLKNLLATGKDEVVLGIHISEEEASSLLESLSQANTVEEVIKFFSSPSLSSSYWYFSLFIAINHNTDLLTDMVYHLEDVEHWEDERTYTEKEKKRVEKEIADLEERHIYLKREEEILREQIEKALQE
ncbi:MAG: hypothetical protein HFJ26_06820 [Clostridia bacterium]|nr:hypothetical protein [Clostridia bacterium]